MTISSTTRKAGPFSGTGAQTVYPFTFKVFTAEDMLVVLTDSGGIEAVQVLTTNYTVALNADQNVSPGGSITMLVAPPAGYLLTVGSVVQPTQGQSIPNMGGFYPKVIENALDKLTISVQQIAESAARSFKLAFSDTGSANLPAAAARANKLLSFDSNGNPVAVAAHPDSATELQLQLASVGGATLVKGTWFGGVVALVSALATSIGSSLLGFIQGGIGALLRSIQSKLRETVSITDYMTAAQIADAETGTPTLDSTASLQAAVDYLADRFGGEVQIPIIHLLEGSGGVIGGRIVDGIKVRSNVSFRWIGAGETRLDPSCVIGFTTRLLAAVTSLADAPHDINFYNPHITRPGSTWDANLENTALIYMGAINRCKIIGGCFVGWPGDAIMLGANDYADLSWLYETYVKDVEISGNFFDGVTKTNRQAVSVFEGVDIFIHHNTITRTTRTAAPSMPGAIDIEPILVSAKIANVRVENNTFDDIGGVTGVVSFTLGIALTTPAHDLFVRFNNFRNITNLSDIYVIGKGAPNHTAVAAGSPHTVVLSGNTHGPVPAGSFNRRWHVGGISRITIDHNTVYSGNFQALIGYDDGTNHWPIDGLTLVDNNIRDWCVEGTIYETPIGFLGGILGGDIKGNTALNCGNLLAGAPQNMTVMGFVSNGVASKNINLSGNHFVNTSTFSANSFPIYAAALTNPLTFSARNNVIHGLGSYAYNGAESIYSQVPCDYYDSFIAIPSTGTPNVGGACRFNAATGDTFTNFTNGKEGQRITIVSTVFGCTIANNATIKTASGANTAVAANKTIELVNMSGVWYQV